MNKIIVFFICIFFVNGCSLNKNSKFWTTSENISEENNSNFKKIFVEDEAFDKEFNANVSINLGDKFNDNFKNKDYFNNDGRLNYNGALKKSSRYSFLK